MKRTNTNTQPIIAALLRPSPQVAVREEVPLGYLPGHTCRIRIKVSGDLDLSREWGGAAAPPAAAPASGAEEAGAEGLAPTAALGGADAVETPAAAAAAAAVQGAAAAEEFVGRGEAPTSAELAAWEPQVIWR